MCGPPIKTPLTHGTSGTTRYNPSRFTPVPFRDIIYEYIHHMRCSHYNHDCHHYHYSCHFISIAIATAFPVQHNTWWNVAHPSLSTHCYLVSKRLTTHCSLQSAPAVPFGVTQAVVGVQFWVCHGASEDSAFFSMCLNSYLTNISPQAKHAETDPRHGTPTMAHFQQPE